MIYGYIRVSTEEQKRHNNSPENQRQIISNYAKTNNLGEVEFFEDCGSGGDPRAKKRPEQTKLLSLAQSGDTILVYAVDRWARHVECQAQIHALLARGLHFYFISQNINPSDKAGDSMLGIMQYVAWEEFKRIQERTNGMRKVLRAKGLYVAGSVPVGYKLDDSKKLIKDPETQPLITTFFGKLLEGLSLIQTCKDMRKLYPERKFDVASYHKLVTTNRYYLGETKAANFDHKDGAREDWIKDTHEPYLSESDWLRINALLRSRRSQRLPAEFSRTRDFLLRGIAWCPDCGAKIASVKMKKGHEYYCCNTTIRSRRKFSNNNPKTCFNGYSQRGPLDSQASVLILTRLIELKDELAKPRIQKQKKPESPVRETLAKLESERVRLLRNYEKGYITEDYLDTRIKALDKEIGPLKVSLATEKSQAEIAWTPELGAELLGRIETLRVVFSKATISEKRKILTLLASRVEIEKSKGISISWKDLGELIGPGKEKSPETN